MHAQREPLAVEVHVGQVSDMDELYDAETPPLEENWEIWEYYFPRPLSALETDLSSEYLGGMDEINPLNDTGDMSDVSSEW